MSDGDTIMSVAEIMDSTTRDDGGKYPLTTLTVCDNMGVVDLTFWPKLSFKTGEVIEFVGKVSKREQGGITVNEKCHQVHHSVHDIIGEQGWNICMTFPWMG